MGYDSGVLPVGPLLLSGTHFGTSLNLVFLFWCSNPTPPTNPAGGSVAARSLRNGDDDIDGHDDDGDDGGAPNRERWNAS